MRVTPTDFRKNLFQLIERAVNGELIEIVHKNRTIRLVPIERESRLSRLLRRDTLICDPDDLDRVLQEQDIELRSQWERKWQSRL